MPGRTWHHRLCWYAIALCIVIGVDAVMKVLSKAFVVSNKERNHHVIALRYFPDRYDEVRMCKETLFTPCPGDRLTYFHDLDQERITNDVTKLPYPMALRYIKEHWDDLNSGDTIESDVVWEK